MTAGATSDCTTPRVSLTMRYFASAAQATGCQEETLTLPASASVESVFAALAARHPPLQGLLPACRLAHNFSFVKGSLTLAAGDELAVIPPVSGG